MFDCQANTYISLERKNYFKHLGVLIDETLSWKYHIVHLASKISKTIGIIARLRHFVPEPTSHIYLTYPALSIVWHRRDWPSRQDL